MPFNGNVGLTEAVIFFADKDRQAKATEQVTSEQSPVQDTSAQPASAPSISSHTTQTTQTTQSSESSDDESEHGDAWEPGDETYRTIQAPAPPGASAHGARPSPNGAAPSNGQADQQHDQSASSPSGSDGSGNGSSAPSPLKKARAAFGVVVRFLDDAGLFERHRDALDAIKADINAQSTER